jgi:uncharacterized protein involved in type VI secretion and phage assembly
VGFAMFAVCRQKMAVHYIPLVGSLVWIEFENGDSNYPIWTGYAFIHNCGSLIIKYP